MIDSEQFKDAFKEISGSESPEEAWEQSGLSVDELKEMDQATIEVYGLTGATDVLSAGIIIGVCLERKRWRLENPQDMPDPNNIIDDK